MANITLVQQAENSSNGVTSCSLTLENCTIGNTLILAYAVLGQGNIPTLSDGWDFIGGGNVVSLTSQSYQCIYFAKKVVENSIETVTLTQENTNIIYMICGEYSGEFSVLIRNDMAKAGTSNFTVTTQKNNDSDVIVYGVSSSAYLSGRAQSSNPSDLIKLQGNADAERLACWFDNGTGALSHDFTTCVFSGEYIAIVECVQLLPKTNKYLIRDNTTIYTVSDGALAEVQGTLNADLFTTYGTNEIPSGNLLMTLASPEVLCWKDSDIVPTLKATVQGTPIGEHDVISDDIRIGHESIFGITSVEATASDGATFSLSFDNGAYMVYDTSSSAWVASDVGMSATELVAIPTDAWSSVVNSATTMRLKATIDGIETVSKVKFNFDNTSPINLESEVE